MKYNVLAMLLAMALLLCGCSLPQTPPPQEKPSTDLPSENRQEQQAQTPSEPELPPVEPAVLPVSGGVDWNTAPESAMGTGGDMPQDASTATWAAWDFYSYSYEEPYVADDLSRTVSVNQLTGLTNTVLQQRINETVQQQIDALIADAAPIDAARAKAATLGEGVTCQMNDNIYTNAYIVGQILSVSVGRELYAAYMDENGEYISTEGNCQLEARCYSLRDGSELLLSDLFSDDCDYAALLRQLVGKQLNKQSELKRPFRGLPADYDKFILSGGAMQLWIPGENPYIDTVFGYPTYVYLSLDQLYPYMPLLQGNPAEHLLPNAEVRRQLLQNSTLRFDAASFQLPPALAQEEMSFTTIRLRQAEGVAAAEINAALERLEADIASGAALGLEELPPYDYGWVQCEYIAYQNHICVFYYISLGSEGSSHWRIERTFDLRTGEMLRLRDVVLDEAAVLQQLQDKGMDAVQAAAWLDSCDFCIYSDLSVNLGSSAGIESAFLSDNVINPALF